MGKASNRKEERRLLPKCIVPECKSVLDPESPFKACAHCTRIIQVILFALPRIHQGPPPPPPGPQIMVPKPGMAGKAIEEELKLRRPS